MLFFPIFFVLLWRIRGNNLYEIVDSIHQSFLSHTHTHPFTERQKRIIGFNETGKLFLFSIGYNESAMLNLNLNARYERVLSLYKSDLVTLWKWVSNDWVARHRFKAKMNILKTEQIGEKNNMNIMPLLNCMCSNRFFFLDETENIKKTHTNTRIKC